MAAQLQQEMVFIEMMFQILELLQILIDVMTFYDLFKADNGFDAGTIAGKGLTNAIFTFYYLGRDLAAKNKPEEDEADVDVEITVNVDM